MKTTMAVVALVLLGGCMKEPAPRAIASPEVGRYSFREFNGWLVRFDSALGTYCSMENISDNTFGEVVAAELKDGATRKDAIERASSIAKAVKPGGECE